MTAPSLPGRTDPSLSGGGLLLRGGDFSSGGTSSLLGGTPSSLSRGTLTEGELSSSASVTSSLELISQSPWPVGSQGGGICWVSRPSINNLSIRGSSRDGRGSS